MLDILFIVMMFDIVDLYMMFDIVDLYLYIITLILVKLNEI